MSQDEYLVRDLRVGDRKEAELLADMWNRSDAGWPGGWTAGVPWDADRVLQEFMSWHAYAQWVVEHRGEIVGYVSLEADPSTPTRAYIGLLSARPDHHGRGVGRRLMRQALRRTIEAGFEEVGVYTWPGNLKAVPLYKKTGFFWSPETSVEMHNFIPTLVRMPLLAGFFREHDWYQVQERDLSVCEDVARRHGVRVYHYRFAAGGRSIQVFVDRQAKMPTAVETDQLCVDAWVGDEDLCALTEHTLRYEFRNKTDRPMSVSVLARGEAGVPVSVEESFELKGRHRLSLPFRLPVDLDRKAPGEPPHRVLSTVTVDGVPVRLGTAVRMRHPVEIAYGGQGLPAGKWSDVRIKLRNRLPFPVGGSLLVGSPPDIERDAEKLSFRIARGGWGTASLRVRAARAGVHHLDLCVSLDDETAQRLAQGGTPALAPRGRLRTVALRAFTPGTFVSSHDTHDRVVTIESDRTVVAFRRVGGGLNVRDKSLGRHLLHLRMPEVGPPFGEFRPTPKVYDADVRGVEGSVHLVTRQQYDRYPGLTVERTVVVASGLLEVRHRLINAADHALKLKVRMQSWGGLNASRLTVPMGDGLLQHRQTGWGDWPRWGELRRDAADFSESWAAADDEGAVIGMVWQGSGEIGPGGSGGGEITSDMLTVPSGGAAELPPVFIVAGPGDHKVVRAIWRTYVSPRPLITPAEREPDTRDVIRAGLSQTPVLLTDRTRRVDVQLTSEEQRALTGKAELKLPRIATLPDGSRGLSFAVRGLDKDKPVRKRLSLRAAADRPTAAVGELSVDSQRETLEFPVPVIVVRAGRSAIKVKQTDDLVEVDTGPLQFQVSAGHGGSIVSLRSEGRELVRSSHPVPRPYHWMNPWHGGICAGAGHMWDRRFLEVRRSLEPVSIVGETGLRWQGAQVTTTYTHADWRWLRCQAQYVSIAGSNLLAIVVRISNRARAAMGVGASVQVWPRARRLRAHVEWEGRRHLYDADEHEYSVRGKSWLALGCGSGSTLALVAGPGADSHVELENLGDGQLRGEAGWRADLTPPVRSFTALAWLAVCRSAEEAYAYRFLKELKELP